jgi:hypothetical protein
MARVPHDASSPFTLADGSEEPLGARGPDPDVARARPLRIRVGSRVAWDLGRLVAEACRRRGLNPVIICPDVLRRVVTDAGFPVARHAPSRRRRLGRKLQHHLINCLVARDFSRMWESRRIDEARSWQRRTADVVRALVPFPGYAAVNRMIGTLTGWVTGPVWDGVVVTTTPMWHSEDLCHRSTRVVTVVESWDHHAKKPYGYCSNHVVGWNRPLLEAWMERQGGRVGHVGYPFKLAYARGARPSQRTAVERVMYALTFASDSPRFDQEVDLIQHIARSLRGSGIAFVVKAKPTETPAGRERLAQASGAEVTRAMGGAHGADFSLTPDYNRQRLAELANVDVVIVYGTTYALDMAIAGVPLVQLDLRPALATWPQLATVSTNEHLVSYLLCHQDLTYRVHGPAEIDRLGPWLRTEGLARALAFSRTVRSWLTGDDGPERALDRIVDVVMELCTR